MAIAYYLQATIEFPEGVHFGAGASFNGLGIATDGQGFPVLNGTSFAGWLRSLWRSQFSGSQSLGQDDPTNHLFGFAYDQGLETSDMSQEASTESCVRVTNYRLQIGNAILPERNHHQRNRHRGTVLDRGLFSVEMCPPGTWVTAGFWIVEPHATLLSGTSFDEQVNAFIEMLRHHFASDVWMGGNSNRGFGRARLSDELNVRRFNLTDLQQHAAYLVAHRQWRAIGSVTQADDQTVVTLPPIAPTVSDQFQLTFTLEIPRGQDILVADPNSEEGIPDPQRVLAADGNQYWRIPGSSLRGLFRSWMHRLAARDAIKQNHAVAIADCADQYLDREQSGQYTGDRLGVGFSDSDQLDLDPSQELCPIVSLFGDLRIAGRIKISDAVTRCSQNLPEHCPEIQDRMHVAVDRVTGGAAKGLLFRNRVLIPAGTASPTFQFHLTIEHAREQEVLWVARTLVALHLGILRVGSSKSAGRLQLNGPLDAQGVYANQFLTALAPIQKSVLKESDHA